jgi:hypothetical protein
VGSRRLVGGLLLVVALATALAACGGSKTGAADQKAAITKSWTTFFDGSTPVAQRVALLQGGDKFTKVINELSASPLASKTAATVSDVTITSPTSATVTFDVSLAGQPVLQNATGQAVLVDGEWKVDAASLCHLLSSFQAGSLPAGCAAAAK